MRKGKSYNINIAIILMSIINKYDENNGCYEISLRSSKLIILSSAFLKLSYGDGGDWITWPLKFKWNDTTYEGYVAETHQLRSL